MGKPGKNDHGKDTKDKQNKGEKHDKHEKPQESKTQPINQPNKDLKASDVKKEGVHAEGKEDKSKHKQKS